MAKISKAWQNQSFVKASVCVTVLNESEETINKLLNALNSQTLKPDEIIIIDAKKYKNCSRSKGRNISIKKAKNEIIAVTDAGCLPHYNWLEKLTFPFTEKNNKVDVVAGGYEMITKNSFQKACSVFLGVNKKDINSDFMPSARSLAFTKDIWKRAGGFPEKLTETAEDTVFNINLIKSGAKFKVVKRALVDWSLPKDLSEFAMSIYGYAKGDAQSGIWWHPIKKFKTHNIKILTVFLRYLIFVLTFYYFGNLYFLSLLTLYAFWAFRKAGTWGVLLQFVSDIAGIIGFSHGILQSSTKRN